MAQIVLAALVLAPLARPEAVQGWVMFTGISAATAFIVFGYLLDGTEVQG